MENRLIFQPFSCCLFMGLSASSFFFNKQNASWTGWDHRIYSATKNRIILLILWHLTEYFSTLEFCHIINNTINPVPLKVFACLITLPPCVLLVMLCVLKREPFQAFLVIFLTIMAELFFHLKNIVLELIFLTCLAMYNRIFLYFFMTSSIVHSLLIFIFFPRMYQISWLFLMSLLPC